MMKQRKHLGILVLLAAAFTGCHEMEEELVQQPVEATWTLTVRASRSDNVTRGITIGDGKDEVSTTKLQSVWKAGEKVYVYKGDKQIGYLTATPDATDAHHATLTGSVTTTDISAGTTRLTLLTPVSLEEWTYTGQNGSLTGDDNSIDSKYNIAKADNVLVTAVSGNSVTTESASFVNQQSIYRLSFRIQKKGEGKKTALGVKRLTLSAANGGLWRNATDGTGPLTVVLPKATTEPIFVALRNQNTTEEEMLNFQAVDNDGITYVDSKTIPAAYKSNGTFVSIKNATLTRCLGVTISSQDKTVKTAL